LKTNPRLSFYNNESVPFTISGCPILAFLMTLSTRAGAKPSNRNMVSNLIARKESVVFYDGSAAAFVDRELFFAGLVFSDVADISRRAGTDGFSIWRFPRRR
jgi:hypothetical protein